MINIQRNSKLENSKHQFDLEERTAKFSEAILDFIKQFPNDEVTKILVLQLIRAVTSIGANYCEASETCTKKDFISKIAIAKKETRETKYWLRLAAHELPSLKDKSREFWKEANELNLIFAAIIRNTKTKIQ